MSRITLFNDLTVYIVTLHFLLFTDFVPEYETQYVIGFSCIGFTCLCIFLNMFEILLKILNVIKLYLIKYFKIYVQPHLDPLFNRYKEYMHRKIKVEEEALKIYRQELAEREKIVEAKLNAKKPVVEVVTKKHKFPKKGKRAVTFE